MRLSNDPRGSGQSATDAGTQQILFVLGSSAGGVVRHVSQAVDELIAALGTDVRVRIVGPTEHADRFGPGSFHGVAIGARPHPRDVVNVVRLRRSMTGADVVHAHGLRAGALATLAARSLPRARRPRIVVTLHNAVVGSRSVRWVSHLLERIVARGADVVLGVSLDIVESVRALGAREVDRALVPAPGGFAQPKRSGQQVRDEFGLDPTTAVVLTVGRLAAQKGLDTLLTASGLVAEQLSHGQSVSRGQSANHEQSAVTTDVVWLVAGSGPRGTELTQLIRQHALPVRLLGARSDVADLLAAADVVVSCAVWEGQPIGIQEALHAGAAIVATDAGGTREVTGRAGAIIVPVGDAHQIAEQTVRLLTDTRLRDQQRSAALERAHELPEPAHMVRQLLDAYGYPRRP